MKTTKYLSIITFLLLVIISCEKEEEKDILVTDIVLNEFQITLEIGDTTTLTATISPDDATDKSVSWISTDETIASVNNGLVTAIAIGETSVKAITTDGGFEATCNINVVPEPIRVAGISLNIQKDTLDIECELQLIATITPDDATDKTINWSSSDEAIATVDNNGLVTAISGGIATITVTTNDGSFEATCEILVNGLGSIVEIMIKGFLQTAGSKSGIDLAVDASGFPYLALNAYDATLASESKSSVEVWKNSGTDWTQFGERIAITSSEAYAPGITIHNNSDVYVSHLYYDNIDDVKYDANVVSYSSGSSWTYLGSAGGSLIKDGNDILNRGSELAFKSDGTLLVANMFYGAGRVHYFDGTNWQSYNDFLTNNSNSFWAGGIDIDCFGNKPLVSIRTSSGTPGKTGILYGNETNGTNGQWEWLGSSYASTANQDCNFQDEKVSDASMAINSSGDVFTAFKALYNGSYHVFVKELRSGESTWNQINSFEVQDVEQVDVVVANNILYLLVANYNDGLDIYKLNSCDIWIYEGKTTKPDTYYNFDVVAGTNGEFFIGYECTDTYNGDVGVFQYVPFTVE
jgi:Bacterial Ig-like domain (group 2)